MTDSSQRIDKWLWFSRQFKTRTLAARIVASGRIRVNGKRITKTRHLVQSGDVITYVANRKIRVLKITGIGIRRSPAVEAIALYEDISPPETPVETDVGIVAAAGRREDGSGRPTKKQRREIDALMDRGA